MDFPKNHPSYIFQLLASNDRAVERAIVAIYNRQTEDEKSDSTTKVRNGMGFAGPDARIGTYYAKWILSGRTLTGKHLDKARQMSFHYIRQLVEVATEKMEAAEISFREAEIAHQPIGL
jgi:hypothetical protein